MSNLKAIKCPKCVAPLQFNGGGRVKTITCAYCKSILDIENEFAILGHFRNIQQAHEVPFKIGMKGVLEEIEYTIIGRITYHEVTADFFWDDFLLFSPLYGYAWLTYEKGHTIYAKRERHLPLLLWEDMNRIETIQINEIDYKVEAPYEAKINYIEGELTWVAKKYDKVKIIDMYAPPVGISMEKTKNEVEFYASKYLDNQLVYDAFAVPKDEQEKNNGVHELVGFGNDFFKPFLKISAFVFTLLVIVLLILNIAGKGELLKVISASNIQESSQKFHISDEKYLTTLNLVSSSKKALNNFNVAIKQKEETLFSINKSLTYINPKITSTSNIKLSTWEPEAKEVLVYLNLPKGDYNLIVSPTDNALSSSISVYIKQGVIRLNYFVWIILIILFVWGLYWIKKRRYEHILDEEEGGFFAPFIIYFVFYPFLAFFIVSSLFKIFKLMVGI